MPRDNSENPQAGRSFQAIAAQLLESHFHVPFALDHPMEIGEPRKVHRFDFVSADLRHVGECKNYSWTEGGNVPSAKMAFVNEAMLYLSFLPATVERFVVMRKDAHASRSETLAAYYYRTYRHLLRGTFIIEVDVENRSLLEIGRSVPPLDRTRHESPQASRSDAGESSGSPESTGTSFRLVLEKTYFAQGFFNVPVEYGRFVRSTDGPVQLLVGDPSRAIPGWVNRRANRNGSARIMGRAALRNWFQKCFRPMDSISVRLISLDSIRLSRSEG